tara:strand:+ start:1714 stop:2022 length:309 start_codon:yes stop_codon:yes gene_type:complete
MLKNKTKMSNAATVWEVFIQSKNGLAHKHVGNVHAEDKEMALQNARDLYTRRNEGSCIWVVKSNILYRQYLKMKSLFLTLQTTKFIDIQHSIIYLTEQNIYK